MNKNILYINGAKLNVEIARNYFELSRGLMERDFLDKNSGMFFIFPSPMQLHFWGKNTKIPLDLAFIDQYLKIHELHIINPLDETLISSTSKSLCYALEVNLGWFNENKIKINDSIKISNI